MPFAEWLVVNQLRESGWPRKRGLRRVPVVDSTAVVREIGNAIQVMLGLGRHQPELAMKLATDLSADQPKEGVNHALATLLEQAEGKITKFGSQRPWRSLMALIPPGATVEVPIPEPEPGQESLEWEDLSKEAFVSAMGMWPAEALAWSLSHPNPLSLSCCGPAAGHCAV